MNGRQKAVEPRISAFTLVNVTTVEGIVCSLTAGNDKDEARIAAAQKKKMWIVAALKAMIKAEEDVVDSERMGVYVDVDKDATAAAVDADV